MELYLFSPYVPSCHGWRKLPLLLLRSTLHIFCCTLYFSYKLTLHESVLLLFLASLIQKDKFHKTLLSDITPHPVLIGYRLFEGAKCLHCRGSFQTSRSLKVKALRAEVALSPGVNPLRYEADHLHLMAKLIVWGCTPIQSPVCRLEVVLNQRHAQLLPFEI